MQLGGRHHNHTRGGGPKGPAPPPPLEIEKPKKKVIRANFKLFHLCFATFLVENITFSAIFWAGPPPLKDCQHTPFPHTLSCYVCNLLPEIVKERKIVYEQ